MPRRAAAACTRLGCSGLVRDGVCSVCGPRGRQAQRDYDKQRGSASVRGYGRRWQRLRKMYLVAHPLCVMCEKEGKAIEATDVDHIIAKRKGGTDAWENLQSLCHSHHSQKTAAGG